MRLIFKLNIRRIGQASFHGKISCPSAKILPCRFPESNGYFLRLRNVCKSPEQLIHTIPQVIQPGTQIFHIRSINAAGFIGTPGVLV